jgi:hypothetical protein
MTTTISTGSSSIILSPLQAVAIITASQNRWQVRPQTRTRTRTQTQPPRQQQQPSYYELGVCYDALLDCKLEQLALASRLFHQTQKTISGGQGEGESNDRPFLQLEHSVELEALDEGEAIGKGPPKPKKMYLLAVCRTLLILLVRSADDQFWTVAQLEQEQEQEQEQYGDNGGGGSYHLHTILKELKIPAVLFDRRKRPRTLQLVVPRPLPASDKAQVANTNTNTNTNGNGSNDGNRSTILEIEPIGERTPHLWERSWPMLEREGLIEVQLKSPNAASTDTYLNGIRHRLRLQNQRQHQQESNADDTESGQGATKLITATSPDEELLAVGKSLLILVEAYVSLPPNQMNSAERCHAQVNYLCGLSDAELKLYRAARAGRDYALLKIIRSQEHRQGQRPIGYPVPVKSTTSAVATVAVPSAADTDTDTGTGTGTAIRAAQAQPLVPSPITVNYWFDGNHTRQIWLKRLQDWMPAWEWQTLQLLAYHNLNNLI